MERLFILLQRHPIRWTAALGWTLWITFWLVQPESTLTRIGIPSGSRVPSREAVSNGFHFLAFSVACAFWFWAWVGHLRPSVSLALATVIAIGLGFITEYQQNFAPDRQPSWNDLISNCVGVIIAAYFIWRRCIYKVKNEYKIRDDL